MVASVGEERLTHAEHGVWYPVTGDRGEFQGYNGAFTSKAHAHGAANHLDHEKIIDKRSADHFFFDGGANQWVIRIAGDRAIRKFQGLKVFTKLLPQEIEKVTVEEVTAPKPPSSPWTDKNPPRKSIPDKGPTLFDL